MHILPNQEVIGLLVNLGTGGCDLTTSKFNLHACSSQPQIYSPTNVHAVDCELDPRGLHTSSVHFAETSRVVLVVVVLVVVLVVAVFWLIFRL